MNLRQKAKAYKKAFEELLVKFLSLQDEYIKTVNSTHVITNELRLDSLGDEDSQSEYIRYRLIYDLMKSEELKPYLVFYDHVDPFTGEKVCRVELKVVKPELEVEE